jgi:hypothetical protein
MMDAPRSFPIEEKVEEAHALLALWEGRLRKDGRIPPLLERLEKNVDASARVMRALRVAQTCKRCEELEGGSCCGAGIENRYDGLQLLINLLLGVSLPDRHTYTDSCYFLQEDGCCLKARHVLCVNYLCTKLKRTLSHDDMVALQTIVGEELDTGFALYEAIKSHMGLGTSE